MNETLASVLQIPAGVRGMSGSMPGLVRKIQLISRTLESNPGTNLLK